MEREQISLPDNKNWEYSNNQSYQLAVERLEKIEDYVGLCARSGSGYDAGQHSITLKYLGREYSVSVTPINLSAKGSEEDIPIREHILILHYILNAKGTPLSGSPVTFKELPEGPNYFRTFIQRTIKNVIANFSENPQKLLEAGKILGGRRAEYGDMAITIDAFNRVPVTLVVWKGDDEFPAEGNVFYDSTVSDYLPTEDIIVLTETIIWKLIQSQK